MSDMTLLPTGGICGQAGAAGLGGAVYRIPPAKDHDNL